MSDAEDTCIFCLCVMIPRHMFFKKCAWVLEKFLEEKNSWEVFRPSKAKEVMESKPVALGRNGSPTNIWGKIEEKISLR